MSYRYQEILAWIIPGFYIIAMLFFIWGLSADIFQSLSITDVDNSSIPFKTVVDSCGKLSTIVIFCIPIVSLIAGWIINALGGITMSFFGIRNFIIRRTKFNPEKIGGNDKVAIYNENIESTKLDILEKYDRFYYRYVLSRNMLTAQILVIAVCLDQHISHPSLKIEIFIAFIFCVIMVRDLRIHAKFVISSPSPKKS